MCGYISGVAFHGVLKPAHECTVESGQLLGVACSLKWRLMLGSPMVAPVILMMYIFTQPESPRWSIGRGLDLNAAGKPHEAKMCFQEAFAAFVKLRHTKLQAARDMFLVYHQLANEKEVLKHSRARSKWYKKGVFELVTQPRNRKAFVASLTCMFAQQFW